MLSVVLHFSPPSNVDAIGLETMTLPSVSSRKSDRILTWAALALSAVCLLGLVWMPNNKRLTNEVRTEDTFQKVKSTKKILAGWVPYAPYVSLDPTTQKPKGFYVDIFSRVANEADIEVEWTETTWATMISDLKLGRIDVMAAPIFKTIPRAKEVRFTRSIDRFGLSAIVLSEARNVTSPLEFNDPSFTITVTQGEVGHEFALKHLPRANIQVLKAGDISLALVNVIEGRANVGICDSWTAAQFAKKHHDTVRDLFANRPFAQVGSGWIVRQEDQMLCEFLNTSIEYLQVNGEIQQLASMYDLPSLLENSK